MRTGDWVTEEFEANRLRLRAVAYRMLGSRAEAEDVVQEAWLRLGSGDPDRIDNLGGWLTTVTARVCLDRLRSRGVRREDAAGLGGELPDGDAGSDPVDQALLAESVGAAMLVVLEALDPAERVAFVLHDVFAVPFDEIAPVVGRTSDAARQLASRARRRVQGTTATAEVDLVRQREVVDAFLRAARGGDFGALLQVLDPDVVLQPDADAQRMGALRPLQGAAAVAGALRGGAAAAKLAIVDGVTGLAWAPGGAIRGFVECVVHDGRIVAMNVVGDPARVAAADIVVLDG